MALESFVKLRFLSFYICLSVNQRTVFWRLKMYLQFAPKMNWSSKYFTPFRTVMSAPGSRCKLPANRTRTPDFHNRQNRNSRESSTFPIIFFPAWRRKLWDSHSFSMIKYTTSSLSYFHLSLLFFAPTSMFSIDNYMYVINQKEKKKKACFSDALVWRMAKRRTLVTQLARRFFCYPNIHKF